VFIQGAFGKLTLGDVDGAAETAAGNISGVGLTGLGDYNDTFYYADFVGESAGDPQALFEYRMSGFGFFLSAKDGNGAVGGRGIPAHVPTGQFRTYGVGVSYAGTFSGGSFQVGVGYEHLEDILFGGDGTNVVLGGTVTFGDTTVKAVVGTEEFGIFETTQFGLSVDQKFGATTVTAFWRQLDYNLGGGSDRYLGLGVAHSLGGGATIRAGIVNEEISVGGATFDDTWGDIGIALTF
jgi:outer membrane protein OmpU